MNLAMLPCSLSPYRSVLYKYNSWDTLCLIKDDVSAVCLPTVLPGPVYAFCSTSFPTCIFFAPPCLVKLKFIDIGETLDLDLSFAIKGLNTYVPSKHLISATIIYVKLLYEY